MPGLLTAFVTSSSYAALPQVTEAPLLKDSRLRGVFDLCTTLNKTGTTIYISAVAAYAAMTHMKALSGTMFVAFAFAPLASLATAGLPFAAVFGLRMVLMALGMPGGMAWLILPIDPLLDRFVTVLNVFANLAACSTGEAAQVEKKEMGRAATLQEKTLTRTASGG